MGYQALVSVEDSDERRRHGGTRWICDADFVERLVHLIDVDGISAAEIARELSSRTGEPVEASAIRQLKRGETASSVYVGPICVWRAWPVPPMAEADDEFGSDAAMMYELRGRDAASASEYREMLKSRLKAVREIHELRRGTPEKPEP